MLFVGFYVLPGRLRQPHRNPYIDADQYANQYTYEYSHQYPDKHAHQYADEHPDRNGDVPSLPGRLRLHQ
jgi:hypothetical protein